MFGLGIGFAIAGLANTIAVAIAAGQPTSADQTGTTERRQIWGAVQLVIGTILMTAASWQWSWPVR